MINTRKTIEINGAKITLKPLSGWAFEDGKLLRSRLLYALGSDEDRDGVKYKVVNDLEGERFGKLILMILCTDKVKGKLGFEWPPSSNSIESLVGAYHAVGEHLKPEELTLWIETIEELNAPPGDPETAPADPAKK